MTAVIPPPFPGSRAFAFWLKKSLSPDVAVIWEGEKLCRRGMSRDCVDEVAVATRLGKQSLWTLIYSIAEYRKY